MNNQTNKQAPSEPKQVSLAQTQDPSISATSKLISKVSKNLIKSPQTDQRTKGCASDPYLDHKKFPNKFFLARKKCSIIFNQYHLTLS